MIGKILYHLLGNAGEDFAAADDTYEEVMELEEEGWVIVNLPGEINTDRYIISTSPDCGYNGMLTDLFELGCSSYRERTSVGP